jgi:hypothetical protein
MIKQCIYLIFITLTFSANARDFNKFQNQAELFSNHYSEYFKHETCYEYTFDQLNPYYDTLRRNFNGNLFKQLKKKDSNNQQLLYKNIVKRCLTEKKEMPNSVVEKHPRKEYLHYNYGTKAIDKIVAKIICLSSKDKPCDKKLSNQEIESIIRSKQNYVHEQVQQAKSKQYNDYLTQIIEKQIKTTHSGLAYWIYKDAQLLYQCKIGKDCSSTSMYMIKRCVFDKEFCGLSVNEYLKKYKTSPSQYTQIQNALDLLIGF